MSLYSFYTGSQGSPQQQGKSKDAPIFDCTWSFLETPALILSDDDTSSYGPEDMLSAASSRPEGSLWNGNYVQFESVNVREYIRVRTEHPACMDRHALSIGWAHGDETSFSIDEYEEIKTRKRTNWIGGKRRGLAKRLDSYTRRELLETKYSLNPDIPNEVDIRGDIGVECQLEMEPESDYDDSHLLEDRWGCFPGEDPDCPPDDPGSLQVDEYPDHFGFPDCMMKVQIIED